MAVDTKATNKIEKRQKGVVRAHTDFFRSARYGLTLTEHRIIYYAILRGQQDKKPFEPVTISVQEFKALCELKGQSSYSVLKNITRKLLGKVLEVGYRDTDGYHFKQATWVKSVTYHAKVGTITIALNEELKPFFEGRPFTDTEYFYLIRFTCQYSERLYEILKTFAYKAGEPVGFKVSDLRKRLGFDQTTDNSTYKYPNFYDFKRYVLIPALKDLNEYTDITVEMEEKRGQHNKVETVIFSLEKKDVPKLFDRIHNTEDFTPPLSDSEQEKVMQDLIGDETLIETESGRLETILEVQAQSEAGETELNMVNAAESEALTDRVVDREAAAKRENNSEVEKGIEIGNRSGVGKRHKGFRWPWSRRD